MTGLPVESGLRKPTSTSRDDRPVLDLLIRPDQDDALRMRLREEHDQFFIGEDAYHLPPHEPLAVEIVGPDLHRGLARPAGPKIDRQPVRRPTPAYQIIRGHHAPDQKLRQPRCVHLAGCTRTADFAQQRAAARSKASAWRDPEATADMSAHSRDQDGTTWLPPSAPESTHFRRDVYIDGTFTITLQSDGSTVSGPLTGVFCGPGNSHAQSGTPSFGNPRGETDAIRFSGGTGQFAGLQGTVAYSQQEAGAHAAATLRGTLSG